MLRRNSLTHLQRFPSLKVSRETLIYSGFPRHTEVPLFSMPGTRALKMREPGIRPIDRTGAGSVCFFFWMANTSVSP